MINRKPSKKKLFKIPAIIPPESIVELVRADNKTPLWKEQIGKRYRIGYYSKQDGLDTIWLVDDGGDYCETTDRDYLLKYFKIERLSKETDFFGTNRRRIGPIRRKGIKQGLRVRVKTAKRDVRLPSRWSSKIIARFKWPIQGPIQKLRSVFSTMQVSRRKQPPLYYFIWPDKMRRLCFKGDLERLMRSMEKSVERVCSRLRQAVKKRNIEDWQVLIIRSLGKPDIVWVAAHRVYFITGDRYDIWPEIAIQRVAPDKYLVWKSKDEELNRRIK